MYLEAWLGVLSLTLVSVVNIAGRGANVTVVSTLFSDSVTTDIVTVSPPPGHFSQFVILSNQFVGVYAP